MDRFLLWYRNDLRIHDHEPLYRAFQQQVILIPCYCFDPRQFAKTSFGFPKMGGFRAQFLWESLINLRENLQSLGSDLLIRQGLPEQIIPLLAKSLGVSAIYYHYEVAAEERAVESALHRALAAEAIQFQGFWGSTLYHPDDRPFSPAQTPELFTNFRKQVEKYAHVSPPVPTPTHLSSFAEIASLPEISSLPGIDFGEVPSLTELGLTPPHREQRAVLFFKGGETAGLERLNHYFWQQDCLKSYKETRNGLLGADYSSKFSPWLALGCLSPRLIYEQVKCYEENRVKNDSTYWLIFELIWRDFFRAIAHKHGNKLFHLSGIQKLNIPWKEDWERFQIWQEGKTGYPLVDANMRELLLTGFMSNRGRQNVGSFLTKNLGINWKMGAEWFESCLIDYDVYSNWGNWNYTAGVGNDARGFRYFNIPKQSRDYDPKGLYIKHWLPELASLPGDKVHQPWMLSTQEQRLFKVHLGVDYPRPIVQFFPSIQANEKVYNAALNSI